MCAWHHLLRHVVGLLCIRPGHWVVVVMMVVRWHVVARDLLPSVRASCRVMMRVLSGHVSTTTSTTAIAPLLWCSSIAGCSQDPLQLSGLLWYTCWVHHSHIARYRHSISCSHGRISSHLITGRDRSHLLYGQLLGKSSGYLPHAHILACYSRSSRRWGRCR